jgi:hypothetical protein
MAAMNTRPATRTILVWRWEVEATVEVAMGMCRDAAYRTLETACKNSSPCRSAIGELPFLLLEANMPENDLIQRIERLEKGNRRWKLAALVLLLAALVLLLAGFDSPQPYLVKALAVEAQSFVLKDGAGQVRARMALSADGPRLTFFDEHGNVISSLPLKPEIRPAQ